MSRPIAIRLLPALCALLLAAGTAAAQVPAERAATAGPFAGYELVEVSFLLRAPDGSLVRLTRQPPGISTRSGGMGDGSRLWPSDAQIRAQPVLGLSGWLSDWLFAAPRAYAEISDYVRESWAMLLRMRDYLGVGLLIGGSWVIWFLVRPVLLGLSDRWAFLLAFALVSGLWLYTTALYMSVVYALGLMLLPAAVLAALGWAARRAWNALRSEPTSA